MIDLTEYLRTYRKLLVLQIFTSDMKVTPIKPQPFSDAIYAMDGISKRTVEEHMKLYEGYVSKYNEINNKLSGLSDQDLADANQTYSHIRALKVELTFAYGGMINHEIYFGHLGGSGKEPTGELMDQITNDFGSFEAYKKDLTATGIAARGWVWTAWNVSEKRLFNYLGDAQNAYPIWGAVPIVALDTYEHAYFIDYGKARAKYIEAFFQNMDWGVVESTFAGIQK
jgi:Fe-Mn family superoxide dismutase